MPSELDTHPLVVVDLVKRDLQKFDSNPFSNVFLSTSQFRLNIVIDDFYFDDESFLHASLISQLLFVIILILMSKGS